MNLGTVVDTAARKESRALSFTTSLTTTSSPRSWGTLVQPWGKPYRNRFIPTLVGNTAAPPPADPLGPVHPHARGEHEKVLLAKQAIAGSSPRSWGTHTPVSGLSRSCRFIPTLVGNTDPRNSCYEFFSVHPHARGEHSPHTANSRGENGSSPRSWGTLNPK